LSSQSPHDALATFSVSSRGIKVSGEIDISNVSDLTARLRDAIGTDGSGSNPVIIDLTDLGFLDAHGISALVASQQLAGVHGKRVILANPSEMVRKLLRITETDSLLPVRGLRAL
jgi:anti-sigma B factor antagonist